jgi:isopenicillin-N epimerase
MTLVDGAHAPGQIPLNLNEIGADFYVGNGHKWLCGPKGSAFLHARRERQPLIEPLIVGWGWGEDRKLTFGSDFVDYIQWWGTYYIAAYLSIPAAIEFQAAHNWPAVQERCHALLEQALGRMNMLTGLEPIYPDGKNFYYQMAIAPIPLQQDIEAFKSQLYDRFRIEIPCIEWNDRHFIRLSVQGYNNQADLDALLEAMEILLSGR